MTAAIPAMTDGEPCAATAILDVDLSAIAANWRELGRRHPSGPAAAVLKANAYGMGAVAVATRLRREGCAHFFVATLDEAREIRGATEGAMLAVLNGPVPGTETDYVQHGIAPVLGSLADIDAWRAHGQGRPALLHIDTGMARTGLDAGEVAGLSADPSRLAGIPLLFVMTHLVSSDLPHDAMNAAQAARFAAACAALPPVPRSIANSSGIFLGAAMASDLARPGAALYGINPTPGLPNPMRAVARLTARVLRLRDVATGEGVGYNETWRAPGPCRIATVALGYADGWHRSLSNRGCAFFDGTRLPLVGRVSMDLTTFDATGAPGLRAGDWLELIGQHHDVDAVAADASTNGYEVFTSLGPRITRRLSGA